MTDYLLCYDITCPRRLGRVHRTLSRYAMPIEYSVFLLIGTEQMLEHCLQESLALIDRRFDDLRCYPLPARGLRSRFGRATLPEGIQWSGLPAHWL